MLKRVLLLSVFSPLLLLAQQNQQLYHAHYLGQSNFLNPAVQSTCKWFIGIPVLSSIHINYANSAFSLNQLLSRSNDQTLINIDEVVDRLGRRSFIGTEIHTSLIALGYKRGDYYFNFSINEKNDASLILPKEIVQLGWKGNSQFVGQNASSQGMAIRGTHYREYAFGVSRQNRSGNYLGLKAKLLFGKYDISSQNMNINLFTDASTFDLTLSGMLEANSSFRGLELQRFRPFILYGDFNLFPFLFNRRNWGLALDFGFIKQLNSKLQLSGSLLDLGFIRWNSNAQQYSLHDGYTYRGVLVQNDDVLSSIDDSAIAIELRNYRRFLPPKAYLGLQYEMDLKLTINLLASADYYPTKLVSKFTLGADYNLTGNFHILGSYSLLYRSYNNVGLGFSAGREKAQFYFISDNALGMLFPLSAQNLNLRFGLNLNFGCKEPNKYERLHRFSGSEECHTYEVKTAPNRRRLFRLKR